MIAQKLVNVGMVSSFVTLISAVNLLNVVHKMASKIAIAWKGSKVMGNCVKEVSCVGKMYAFLHVVSIFQNLVTQGCEGSFHVNSASCSK